VRITAYIKPPDAGATPQREQNILGRIFLLDMLKPAAGRGADRTNITQAGAVNRRAVRKIAKPLKFTVWAGFGQRQ
jgi:hypothetical protein